MLSKFSQAGLDCIYNTNWVYFHGDNPEATFPEAVRKLIPLSLFKYANNYRFLERIMGKLSLSQRRNHVF